MVPPNEPPCAAPSPPAVPAREGITTGPPEDVRIPLPAEPWAPPPERRPPAREAESGRLGGALVFLVAALAFLLASFPARNGDLWLHLAAGRLLAHGESPFAAGAGLPVNVPAGPGWAYDLLTYALYSALGGAGLVVLKALLVVGLALILTRLGRAGRGWTLPAFCAALALLAMSTRLLVQPATVSCFFLALCLWFLRDDEESDARRPPPLSPPWPLAVLFPVWANMDGWFVLGLGTVALVWLGRALDLARRRPAEGRRSLASLVPSVLVPLAVLAALCLLNPSHVYAFAALPWSSAASSGPGAVTSPFQAAYLARFGTSPAGLAYFPLLGLGLLSFLLNLPGWSWRRVLPWSGLAVLSALQVKAVPFFAVVAGPVLALNLQEALARRPGAELPPSPARRREVIAGRVLAVLLGVALVVCAWPGWLQGPPYGPRRWAVEAPPSLERGAAATRLWHEEGKLGVDARGLHLSPESAFAFAWFCPQERGLVDEDLAAAVRGEQAAGAGWEGRMRAAGVDHVIVYDPDRDRLLATLSRLLADPVSWPLLYLEGDLAVFGWRDPAAAREADPFRDRRLDLDRLAFDPSGQSTAPRSVPGRAPEARPWWAALWRPAPPPSLDHDEAVLHLMHAEALRRFAPLRHRFAWDYGQSAALTGAAAGWAGPADLLDAHARLMLLTNPPPPPGAALDTLPFPEQVAMACKESYARDRDDTPPALLYLAVRAARRAVAANPEDARAYLVLGESYLRFLHGTRERAWAARMRQLAGLRYAQAAAALNRAVALKPDLAQAHLDLARLYVETGSLDLALDHLREHARLLHAAGPPRGASADEFREQEGRFREEVDRLAQEVERQQNVLAAGPAGAGVLEKALAASDMGLKGKALELLLESDVAAFGPRGMELELELLLMAGRAADVRDWTSPEHEAALGGASYHWLRVRALAASGEYASAEEECASMLPPAAVPGDPGPLRTEMALRLGQAVLNEAPGGVPAAAFQKALTRPEFRRRAFDLAESLRQEADVRTLRGLLTLEEGRLPEAEADFRLAVGLWRDAETAASGGGLDFGGRVIAQDCLEWLRRDRPAAGE